MAQQMCLDCLGCKPDKLSAKTNTPENLNWQPNFQAELILIGHMGFSEAMIFFWHKHCWDITFFWTPGLSSGIVFPIFQRNPFIKKSWAETRFFFVSCAQLLKGQRLWVATYSELCEPPKASSTLPKNRRSTPIGGAPQKSNESSSNHWFSEPFAVCFRMFLGYNSRTYHRCFFMVVPTWKMCLSNWIVSPRFSLKIQQNLGNQHQNLKMVGHDGDKSHGTKYQITFNKSKDTLPKTRMELLFFHHL